MARRARRRGGIIKLYPPPLASQQLPANHQPHFMKGERGGEGSEERIGGEGRERREGQRKGRRGRIKDSKGGKKKGRKGRRKEKGRDEQEIDRGGNDESGSEKGITGGGGGSGGGNKGKQVSVFKTEKERRRWKDGGRTSGAGRLTAAQHPPLFTQPLQD